MTSQYGDLLTMGEAAKMLRVSKRTAERLALAGEFPGKAAFRVGKQWRVSRPLLDAHMNGVAETAPEPPDAA